jgi:hypothetical protein
VPLALTVNTLNSNTGDEPTRSHTHVNLVELRSAGAKDKPSMNMRTGFRVSLLPHRQLPMTVMLVPGNQHYCEWAHSQSPSSLSPPPVPMVSMST